MRLTFEELAPRDARYKDFESLAKRVVPHYARTADQLIADDQELRAKYFVKRFAGYDGGSLVGMTRVFTAFWQESAKKMMCHTLAHPDAAPDVFGELAEFNIETARQAGAAAVEIPVDVSHPTGRDWLAGRGFAKEMELILSRLDLTQELPEPEPMDGIEFVTPEDLDAQGQDGLRLIYDCDMQAAQDIPMNDEFTGVDYALWRAGCERDGTRFVAAIVDGKAVACSSFEPKPATPGECAVGFTGVLREYRRRGLARALKHRANLRAQAEGARSIFTENEPGNPMLQLNLQLGFVPFTTTEFYKLKL